MACVSGLLGLLINGIKEVYLRVSSRLDLIWVKSWILN